MRHDHIQSAGFSRRALFAGAAAAAAVPTAAAPALATVIELQVLDAINRHRAADRDDDEAQIALDELLGSLPYDVRREPRVATGHRLTWTAEGEERREPIFAYSEDEIDARLDRDKASWPTNSFLWEGRAQQIEERRVQLKAELEEDARRQAAKQEVTGLVQAEQRADHAEQFLRTAEDALYAARPRTVAGVAMLASYAAETFGLMPSPDHANPGRRLVEALVHSLNRLASAATVTGEAA